MRYITKTAALWTCFCQWAKVLMLRVRASVCFKGKGEAGTLVQWTRIQILMQRPLIQAQREGGAAGEEGEAAGVAGAAGAAGRAGAAEQAGAAGGGERQGLLSSSPMKNTMPRLTSFWICWKRGSRLTMPLQLGSHLPHKAPWLQLKE